MTASGQIASFPKSVRIQASSDFRNNKENGERLAKGCLLANWQISPTNSSSRLGVVTSRHLGKAVIRNRARRLIRECFRLHKKNFIRKIDLILIARKSIAKYSFHDVEKDFIKLLKKCDLLSKDAMPYHSKQTEKTQ
jgi:ribonuclease P protein component